MVQRLIVCVSFCLALTAPDAAAQLTSPTNRADYLLLHSMASARPAAVHAQWRDAQGLTVRTIDVADIEREFPAASRRQSIRNFISYALTSWTPPLPRFVLLLGDSAAIPTWPHVSTDDQLRDTAYHDWQYVINQNENDVLPDAAIGRLPASDSATAELLLAKTRYYSDTMRRDETLLDFLQLTDTRDGEIFEYIAESDAADHFSTGTRRSLLSARQGAPQYATRDAMWTALRGGVRVLLYYGHGSLSAWSHERLLAFDNLDSAGLPATPFFVGTMACSQQVLSGRQTLFGGLLLRPRGGAVATLGSTGLNYASVLSTILFATHKAMLLDGETAGTALLKAVRASASWEAYRMNFAGDPALKLPRDIVADVDDGPSEIGSFTVRTFPNPAHGEIHFQLSTSREEPIEIDIVNRIGARVAQIRTDGATRIRWDVSHLPSGLYMYRAYSGARIATGTLHIVR